MVRAEAGPAKSFSPSNNPFYVHKQDDRKSQPTFNLSLPNSAMLLRSSKGAMKKPKHSSSNNDETKQDLLSKLPDALLTDILSLLPDADVCRTSVLSSRWKDLWMFLPTLHFVMPLCWSNKGDNELYYMVEEVKTPVCWSMEEVDKFYDLVDKVLALRDGMPIQRFFLYCSKDCEYDRVHDWLRIAFQCKVQIIVLRFPPERYTFRFFWDLFKTCDTLVELSLEGQFQLDVPKGKAKVLFPCLKKISLLSINFCQFFGDELFDNLITGCPVLEELCFERHNYDDLKIIKVSSKTLKRLRICFTLVEFDCKVLIDAPRLEYLDIKDEVCSDFSFTKKPLSLIEARIHTNTISVAQIVRNISAAKVLTLTFPTQRV